MSVKAALPVLSNIVESDLAGIGQRLFAMESSLSRVRADVHSIKSGRFTVSFEPSSSSVAGSSEVAYTTPCGKTQTPPVYPLSRGLRAVSDVWTEFESGWQGGPAVQDLEKQYGPSRRADESERKYFSRRRVYYDAIQLLTSQQRLPPRTVAELLKVRRQQMNVTLDRLMKEVKRVGVSAIVA
jgi:hypothetical protein